jgi:trimeric autotransporter adhesin
MMNHFIYRVIFATAIAAASLAPAQSASPFSLVKDIGTQGATMNGLAFSGQGSLADAVVIGPNVFFLASRPDTGLELWRTNGADTGTALVRDTCPGRVSGMTNSEMIAFNGKLLFTANDCGATGVELWISDGTPAGTRVLKDIRPGSGSSFVNRLSVGLNTVYFSAFDGSATMLWRTDGTPEGTQSLGIVGEVQFAIGNYVVFRSTDATGCTLKRVDVTNNAIIDIGGVCPGTGSVSAFELRLRLVIDGIAYYTAGTASTGAELWRTDGTPAGTFLLKDILAGADTSRPAEFLNVSGKLVFSADDGNNGREPWVSDGTVSGTKLLFDVFPGAGSGTPAQFTRWRDRLYFIASPDGSRRSIWEASADLQTAAELTALVPTSASAGYLAASGDMLYFVADVDGKFGVLFKANTPTAGATRVSATSDPTQYSWIVPFGSGVLLAGSNEAVGREPWISDGTAAGTRLIKDIAPPETFSSDPAALSAVAGRAVFIGYDYGDGFDDWLFSSDGSATGTSRLAVEFGKIPPPVDLVRAVMFQENLCFWAVDGINGYSLWKTDGTVANTSKVFEPGAQNGAAYPTQLLVSNQALYFTSDNNKLWKSGGTTATTTLVKTLRDDGFAYPGLLTADGRGGVYFRAEDATNGAELWHSDGSDSGTRMVKNIQPSGSSSPSELTQVDNVLYFMADDGVNGRELWVSDGTEGGTRLVKDIAAGADNAFFSASSPGSAFANLNGKLVFSARTSQTGFELWISDGSANGTSLVKDIVPGAVSSDVSDMRVLSGTLFFVANDSTGRRSLWRSDGTTAGTVMVVKNASAPINPQDLRVIDGQLYFSAADLDHGRELWRSDGTVAGTSMLQDLYPGSGNGNPTGMIAVGKRLFFNAYQPGAGYELWSGPIPAAIAHRVRLPLISRGS